MSNKIIDEAFADLLIENTSKYALENPENLSYINTRYSIMHVPVESINKCSISDYAYVFFPLCFTLESILSLEKSGITAIQNNPNLALKGKGVLVGIVDTGIDYRHEAFLYPDKTTKIISIWDQTINNGEISENIKYGTEYSRDEINNALKADNPLELVPTNDEIGHGTMLAGIINGNENISNNFRGVVPDTELIVVKLKQAKKITRDFFAIPKESICYQSTDILFGLTYIIEIARQQQKPLVICLAIGTGLGAHDNRGTISSTISLITDNPGNAVVTSAGNLGNARRHYFGNIDRQIGFNEFELKIGAGEEGFTMEIWQSIPHRLSISVTSPSGEVINPIFPSLNQCRRNSFIFETSVMYISNIISESQTGDQLIFIRFEYPAEGIWKFKITNIDGLQSSFNAWLPSGDLITNETFFLNSNPDTTITGPGNSLNTLTITAYNHENDSIWIESSRGYTRTGSIKPDLAAPGVNIVCPLINGGYGTVTGTGSAAAHAAGINAMFLEWGIVKGNYPNMSGNDIRQILIRGAKRKNGITYPNNIWGYGIIDILGAFQNLK